MTLSDYKEKKVIAMIPARMGSARLTMKNLALLNGKPLIYYAIRAAKESSVFDRIVLNSENEVFEKISGRYEIEFYKRPAKWGTSGAKSDSVVYDFVKKNPCDIVVWVNPVSPLQTGKEIKKVVDFFIKEKLDSLITVSSEQVHSVFKNKPINFKVGEAFARTQDLTPVQPFVYSLMMWRTNVFKRTFEKKGYAVLCGKVGYYPVSKLSAIIIKRKEDLLMAGHLMKTMNSLSSYEVKYDRIVESVEGKSS